MNKNWITRFALFAILGAIFSSTILVGCSGGEEDDTTTNTTTTEKTTEEE